MRSWLLVVIVAACDATPSSVPDGSEADLSGHTSDGGADLSLAPPPSCGPLPAPTGPTTMVTAAQADSLWQIVRDAAAGSTILLADGTYRPTSANESNRRLQFGKAGVTLRSASGNREAVILDGEWRTNEMIFVSASDVTIADLTVMRAVDHPIHVTGGAQSITGVRLHNLHIVDGNEQQIKVNTSGASPSTYADNGRLECSLIELTAAGRARVETLGGTSCYTGGIDAHQARGWVVRLNTFRGIYCDAGPLAEHAVHFWNAARDTLVERNLIVDCARGVGFGLGDTGTSRPYADDPYPGVGFIGHYDGIIRRNVIVAGGTFFDTGIELAQARGVGVYHNTILHPAAAFSSIDWRFPNTLADVRNNIVRKLTDRGGTATQGSNLASNDPLLFADAPGGDYHLRAGSAAVDSGEVVAEAGADLDGAATPVGKPDVGADELGAP